LRETNPRDSQRAAFESDYDFPLVADLQRGRDLIAGAPPWTAQVEG
jgi:hypothetical protein